MYLPGICNDNILSAFRVEVYPYNLACVRSDRIKAILRFKANMEYPHQMWHSMRQNDTVFWLRTTNGRLIPKLITEGYELDKRNGAFNLIIPVNRLYHAGVYRIEAYGATKPWGYANRYVHLIILGKLPF